MRIAPGSHELGPRDGSLVVRTFREGVAARVGHDLVLEVGRWRATLDVPPDAGATALELQADPGSLDVREALGGVAPLTDRERAEIRRTIDTRVLRGAAISFRSTRIAVDERDGRLGVEGMLAIGDRVRPLAAVLRVQPGGAVTGAVALNQTDWGIRPYRGLMGALRVRDAVEVVLAARVPVA